MVKWNNQINFENSELFLMNEYFISELWMRRHVGSQLVTNYIAALRFVSFKDKYMINRALGNQDTVSVLDESNCVGWRNGQFPTIFVKFDFKNS